MKKDVVMVVLAAGAGKRFSPFVTDKTLFPFFDRPFVELTIPNPLPDEILSMIIVTNPVNKSAYQHVRFSLPHELVVQEKPNGMAGAMLAAERFIRGRRIVVVIADDISNPTLTSSMMKKVRPDVFGVLTVWKPKTYFPGGYVVFREGQPVGIVEKPGKGKTPSEYVYFGGQYIREAGVLVDAIKSVKQGGDDVYEQALTQLMKDYRFATVTYEDQFVSLKYPWHVLDVSLYLLDNRLTSGKGKNVDIRNNVSIEGTVSIGNNVKIFENTKIVGPVYIGDDTIIGSNNIIRESIIGPGCVTGFNTDIARSYIGDNCWFHSNYIGDSVLEGNVSMGAGSVLANLRLDEEEIGDTQRRKLGAMIARDVRIGVNASIMPGVTIGHNSIVGAGVVLTKDLPEDSFCVAKNEYIMKKNTKSISSERSSFRAKL